MISRKKRIKSIISAVVILSTLFTFAPSTAKIAHASAEESTELTFEEEQGSILHAWNWSFKTIEENLKAIADAGYTAIQVSPIQGNKDLNGDKKDTKDWWILYQPINFKIGNKQLGTREEFKEMCGKAEELGIKIYVDVIANHTANTDEDDNQPNENVDQSIKDLGEEAYHNPLHSVGSWDDRYEVTHGCVGLPDLNTENKKIQEMFRSFIKDCLDCGADGFRFDTAKHIGLPTDEGKSASDFWPNVFNGLKREDGKPPYIYGEVLQGGADNFSEYSKYINLTSSNYGVNVRKAVGLDSDVDVSRIEDYDSDGVDPAKLITWVESHDTYANDSGESTKLTDEQIKDGWAIIASRADANPVFFNRPNGRGKLDGRLGEQGDDLWRDADVEAVNKFRTKMKDKDEKLVEINNKIMMIERGSGADSGVVIVNMDSTDKNISDLDINLEDGKYSNLGTNESVFEVKDKKMSGVIKKGITVLYNGGEKEEQVLTPKVSIDPDNKSFHNNIELTLKCENTNNAKYSINGGEEKVFKNGDNITIGNESKPGDIINVIVKADNESGNRHAEETYSYIKKDEDSTATIYFKKGSKFKTAYLYAYNDLGEKNAEWPGKKMTYIGNDTYKFELKDFTDCNVIINDSYYGSNQTESLKMGCNDKKIYSESDKSWTKVTEKIDEVEGAAEEGIKGGTSKVYFKKPASFGDYDDVCIYFYGQGSGPDWPGVPMEKVEGKNDLYTYTLPEGKENSMVLFNANKGKVQVPKDTGFKAPAYFTYIYDDEWKEYLDGNSKVYFRNPEGSDKPYVYCWKDNGESNGGWPGAPMEKVKGTETLYSYTLPRGFNNVIVSNEGKNQSKDLKIENESSMIYDNNELRAFKISDLKEPEKEEIDEDEKEDEKGELTKAYFYNSDNWKDLKVYVYSEDKNGNMIKEVEKWPGVDAKFEENKLYSYLIPKVFKNSVVIFNGYIEKVKEPLKDATNTEVTTPAAVEVEKENKQTENLRIKSGEIKLYKDGKWTDYIPKDISKDEDKKQEDNNEDKNQDKNEAVVKTKIEDVTISGVKKVNSTLNANVTFKDNKECKVSYVWQRSDKEDGEFKNIEGAVSEKYTLTSQDVYKYIRVIVTNTETNEESVSSPTSSIARKSSHHSSKKDKDKDVDTETTTNESNNNDKNQDLPTKNDTTKNDENKNDGWILNKENKWEYKENSKVVVGWKNINNKWYFMNNEGIMQTKWILDGDKWYYLNEDGDMKTGWFKDTNNKWYYLNQSGDMKTGWFKDVNNKWYYLNASGDMQIGWFKDTNNKWYYLCENGEMAQDTIIEGYKIDNSGAWIN